MRFLLPPRPIFRLSVTALVAICFVSPDAYGQARGGGRVSATEGGNRAAGGGGLQSIATNQAQAGGGLAVGEGAAAGGGGALSVGDASTAGGGGGLAVKGKGAMGGAGSGGDLLRDEARSTKGGGIAAAEEGSFVRSMSTWVPIIGAVALALTAWFLRYMKGKGV